ncbi:MAG: hypothetical protein KAJ19_29200 [Gammaproteobacteria bacterium]|nr:hypothetical protein [Gammaproteobacteria bacterium]
MADDEKTLVSEGVTLLRVGIANLEPPEAIERLLTALSGKTFECAKLMRLVEELATRNGTQAEELILTQAQAAGQQAIISRLRERVKALREENDRS